MKAERHESLCTRKLDKSSFEVFFSTGTFVRFFLYHVLFHLTGPLVVIVIVIFDSLTLARNTGFFGLNRLSLLQYSIFCVLALMIVLDSLYSVYSPPL